MDKNLLSVVYVLIMIATVVAVDIIFFRRQFFERLISNIGIILVFIAFYLRFIKR